jgi:hemerythrin
MFEWKPEYSVHIPEIDKQHRRLFELSSDLHNAVMAGKGKAVLEKALDRLVDYANVHFATEEHMMWQYKFPQAEAHKMQHAQLTAQVTDLQKRSHRGEKNLSISAIVFLKDWLEQHIAGSDQRYSEFIVGKIAA